MCIRDSCNYALSTNNAAYLFGGGTGQVTVTTLLGCPWTANSSNSWITVTAGSGGTNTGTVIYTVASNTTGLARSGVIGIDGQVLTVSQQATPCSYGLSTNNVPYLF